LHPHDRALLRPLSTLGKPKAGDAAVSFLRRTEYIASVDSKSKGGSALRSLNNSSANRRAPKRKSPEPDRDSPAYVKRKIDQGFSLAQENLKDRTRVRHPTKRNLKLVDAFPLLPDLEAFPDSGSYVTIRFANNPVPKSSTFDKRMLHGIFKPIEQTDAEIEAHKLAEDAYAEDPEHNPKPNNEMNYEFYLASSSSAAKSFSERFDVENPDHDDDTLYTQQGPEGGHFDFNRVRAYEVEKETMLDHLTKYDMEVLLTLNKEDSELYQKAAYFYPIMQKSTIRPQRTKNIARTIGLSQEEEQAIDQLRVTVVDPPEDTANAMAQFKIDPYNFAAEDEEQQVEQADGDEAAAPNGETNGASSSRRRSPEAVAEELDADGDEDDE
jgi:RNA polymerase II-associated factor 1